MGTQSTSQPGPGTGCGVPPKASWSDCTSLLQSPSAITVPVVWIRNGRSRKEFWYACWPTVSKSGRLRPLARKATPSCLMKLTGEWEMLLTAFGLSFPRGEVAGPTTLMPGRKPCSTSQQRASNASYAAGAALEPSALNCGRQKKLTFGSFQMTTSLIEGKRATAFLANVQNCVRAVSSCGALVGLP